MFSYSITTLSFQTKQIFSIRMKTEISVVRKLVFDLRLFSLGRWWVGFNDSLYSLKRTDAFIDPTDAKLSVIMSTINNERKFQLFSDSCVVFRSFMILSCTCTFNIITL